MARYGLAKFERVRKAGEYRRINKEGKRVHGPHFVLIYRGNDLGELRLGTVVSRKVGKAHDRNLVKRRIREHFRLGKHRIRDLREVESRPEKSEGLDLVFIAKPGAASLAQGEAGAEIELLVMQMSQGRGRPSRPGRAKRTGGHKGRR